MRVRLKLLQISRKLTPREYKCACLLEGFAWLHVLILQLLLYTEFNLCDSVCLFSVARTTTCNLFNGSKYSKLANKPLAVVSRCPSGRWCSPAHPVARYRLHVSNSAFASRGGPQSKHHSHRHNIVNGCFFVFVFLGLMFPATSDT